MATRLLRADLHVHTYYSRDAVTSPAKLVDACLRRGINCLAITEHNSIAGALAMRRACPFEVIVGEEIRTDAGEIIGLFLEDEVPPGLAPEETVERIKTQGGLVSVPHPFDRFRHGLGDEGLLRVLPQVDVMETFNARAMLPSDNDRARRFAEEHSLPRIAVSDAHSAWEVGRSYVELPPFKGPEGFLDSVRRAKTVERLSSPLIHLVSRWSVLRRRVLGWKPVRV